MTRLITSLFALLFLLYASLANAADPFTVAGIQVDATADSAFEAQTMAIQDGQSRAAEQLLERLTLEDERRVKPLPELTPEVVGRMIRALEINEEKRSANRYLGNISVAFNPREVQAFVQSADLSLITSQAGERLIVPVGSEAFAKSLNTNLFAHALTPLVPSGLREFVAPDKTRLEEIAAQFGVPRFVVIEETGSGAVIVTDVSLVPESRNSFTVRNAFSAEEIGRKIVNRLEKPWKAASSTTAQADVSTTVSVLYNDHSEWLRLQQVINNSAQIKSARLDALSKDGALMTLVYGGDMGRLQSELRAKGVDVRTDPNIGLVFSRAGRF